MTYALLSEMQLCPTGSTLARAATAFNFSRQFIARNDANRAADFVVILEMAAEVAGLLDETNLGEQVAKLSAKYSSIPGLVRLARGNRTVIKPVSATSYILWFLRPDVAIPCDGILAGSLHSLGYVSAKEDYARYVLAYRVEYSRRQAEILEAAELVGQIGTGDCLRRIVFDTWLRLSAGWKVAANPVRTGVAHPRFA